MNIETLKISVHELAFGMLVVKLDRPWLETPFKLQGFRISNARELRTLEKYCKYVYIDIERGVAPRNGKGERVVLDRDFEILQSEGVIPTSASKASQTRRPSGSALAASVALPAPMVEYAVESTFEAELPLALGAVGQTKRALKALTAKLSGGRRANLEGVRTAAALLEASALRNPDAAMLVRALSGSEPFSYRHCVNSAILGIAIARELGFRRQGVHELAMGILLADIGKLRVPKELLRTPRRLYAHETKVIQRHVPSGVEIATALDGLTPGTIEIIAAHHERFNGSGYPSGLVGGEIPLAGRIAGLVDRFDAITSDRAYSEAIPIHEAVQEMYAATVDVFQRELVEKLILVLGTYPVGSVVELSDGSAALVVALNRHRRLLPKVVRLTDADEKPQASYPILDLAVEAPSAVTIKDVLAAGRYDLERPTAALLGG